MTKVRDIIHGNANDQKFHYKFYADEGGDGAASAASAPSAPSAALAHTTTYAAMSAAPEPMQPEPQDSSVASQMWGGLRSVGAKLQRGATTARRTAIGIAEQVQVVYVPRTASCSRPAHQCSRKARV